MIRILLFLHCLIALPAWAHPLDLALLSLGNRGPDIEVKLEMNPAHANLISELANGVFAVDGKKCKTSELSAVRTESSQVVSAALLMRCPAGAGIFTLDLPFLSRLGPAYRLIYMSKLYGVEHFGDATSRDPTIRIAITAPVSSPLRFAGMGLAHIGVARSEWFGPKGMRFPEGLDHILFVIALVMGGGGLLGLLKTVTGFTIGHSITLAIATLGFVHMPSRLVEAAIALSIAVVAAESLFLKERHQRWKIALGFGMVHGLGFASALTDIHLERSQILIALIGFNVGVEFGQAIIVTCVLPLVYLMRAFQLSRRFALPACTAVVFLTGSFWFLQRAIGN